MSLIGYRRHLYQIVYLALLATSVTTHATEHRFSALEKTIYHLIMESNLPAEPLWHELSELAASTQSQAPEYRAVLLLSQCLVAGWYYPEKIADFTPYWADLSSQLPYKNGSAAEFACQGYAAYAAGSDELFSYDYRAYHQIIASDAPFLKMWISYDYAKSALSYGYIDQAIEAITLSLNIAGQNELVEWQGTSLALLAMAQSDLGLHDDALKTNSLALAMVKAINATRELNLNRGFILTQAEKNEQALATYKQIMQETEATDPIAYLVAAGNVASIYIDQQKTAENLELTEKMLQKALSSGDGSTLAYAQWFKAFVLLQTGNYDDAQPFFLQAKDWFMETNKLITLSDGLPKWAKMLNDAGYYAEAFAVLDESQQIKDQLEQSRRARDAVLQNAMLETEQQRRALLQSQQAHQQDRALLLQKQLQQRLWLTLIVAVIIITALVLFAYYRLRRAHELLEVKNQQLDYESSHDPLTKVFNRRYFNQFIASKLAAGNDALLLLMDIDFFKKVNDTHGHQAGDQVLQIVSKRLASRMRDSDSIVRWGGEEFLLYVDKPADITNCRALVQRLLEEVEGSPIKLDNAELNVTISIGFAYVQLSTQAELELQLAQIDTYLYQAKKQGRNRAVGLFSAHTAAQVPLVITSELVIN